jgi:tetratricopeptide (TPR) repeat protein
MSRSIAVALLALCLAAPAAADDVTQARELFERGTRSYRAGNYREAIGQYEAAYRIKPAGAIHFNIAQCREKLEEWPGALRSYQDYLREVPDARDRAAVRASMGKIERRLAAAGVQALLVYTDPPDAVVRIDGKPRGRSPFQVTLAPGVYRVGLSLEGYQPEEQEVEVNIAATRLLDLVLRPKALPTVVLPAATAAATGAPPKAAPDLTARPPPPALAPAKGPAVAPAKVSVATWVTAGVALAAGAAGVYMGVAAKQQQDKLQDGTLHADAASIASDAESKAKTANVLYGVAGVAAATGVTLYFVRGTF